MSVSPSLRTPLSLLSLPLSLFTLLAFSFLSNFSSTSSLLLSLLLSLLYIFSPLYISLFLSIVLSFLYVSLFTSSSLLFLLDCITALISQSPVSSSLLISLLLALHSLLLLFLLSFLLHLFILSSSASSSLAVSCFSLLCFFSFYYFPLFPSSQSSIFLLFLSISISLPHPLSFLVNSSSSPLHFILSPISFHFLPSHSYNSRPLIPHLKIFLLSLFFPCGQSHTLQVTLFHSLYNTCELSGIIKKVEQREEGKRKGKQ